MNLLNTNKTLFLSGSPRPELCTLAIPLNQSEGDAIYRAQGIATPWAGLMGYTAALSISTSEFPLERSWQRW